MSCKNCKNTYLIGGTAYCAKLLIVIDIGNPNQGRFCEEKIPIVEVQNGKTRGSGG